MRTIATFGLLILVASMTLGGMTNVSATDDPEVLLKIAKRAQEQIQSQISTDSSDEIKRLYQEGTQQVSALEKALGINDVDSAKEHFLSTMQIFQKISRHLTSSDVALQAEPASLSDTTKDPSNDIQRLQVYVNSLKSIAETHDATIDFSVLDELFTKARLQINDHQFALAVETLYEIKEITMEINKELREEASIQESQRANDYAQKYLEQLDRLIENAKKQGIADEIIEKLQTAKENLSSADSPDEIVEEIRKILSIKDQFELTKSDSLESRVLQVEKNLSSLSQVNGVNTDDIADANDTLQSIKHHLSEGEFDVANELLEDLAKQLQEIKNSL